MKYNDFLNAKLQYGSHTGFDPIHLPDCLFDFQADLVSWSLRKGRSALFEDCGLGKSIQSIVWADNVLRKTNKSVLLVTPLSVSLQFVSEGEKFGYGLERTKTGKHKKGIAVTNYESLHKFDPAKYGGIVADESSILKNFDGKIRRLVTQFMRKVPYRLLATATPAPNDNMELGTSSEALGYMTRMNMLGMFFTNGNDSTQQWILKGHAKTRFWEWLSSWARAVRTPSDLGYSDDGFILPELIMNHTTVKGTKKKGFLAYEAATLNEQRDEDRSTLQARCEIAASKVPEKRSSVHWCHLNQEADLLVKLIPGSEQISGSDSDDRKEELLIAFASGELNHLVTKPQIASFGLNWQHCSDVTYFPSHSHEKFYQAIRRCLRFGQERDVTCDLIYSECNRRVAQNMIAKERQAVEMYRGVVRAMSSQYKREIESFSEKVKVPKWL